MVVTEVGRKVHEAMSVVFVALRDQGSRRAIARISTYEIR